MARGLTVVAGAQQDGVSLPTRRDSVKRLFLLSLLLSTWIPMAFFIVLGHLGEVNSSLAGIKGVLLFLGTAHVPATLFFYTDRDFREVIEKNKFRYVYLPIILTVSTGLVFAFAGKAIQVYLLLIYWAWQAHHYGRQNIGIYAFASLAEGRRPATRAEKLAIDLATFCAMLGTFKILGAGVAPESLNPLLNFLYQCGKYAFFGVLVFSVFVFIKNFNSQTRLKATFFFTLMLFFAPVFVSGNADITFLSYAMAHGIQYIIFMTVVSVNWEDSTSLKTFQYRNALKLVGFILVVGLIFYRVIELKEFEFISRNATLVKVIDFAVGAVLGATMAHFVVDAGAWRMSKALQKAYMRRRFGFIFEHAGDSNPTTPPQP